MKELQITIKDLKWKAKNLQMLKDRYTLKIKFNKIQEDLR